jgi:hypothetical protein
MIVFLSFLKLNLKHLIIRLLKNWCVYFFITFYVTNEIYLYNIFVLKKQNIFLLKLEWNVPLNRLRGHSGHLIVPLNRLPLYRRHSPNPYVLHLPSINSFFIRKKDLLNYLLVGIFLFLDVRYKLKDSLISLFLIKK